MYDLLNLILYYNIFFAICQPFLEKNIKKFLDVIRLNTYEDYPSRLGAERTTVRKGLDDSS